MIFCLLLTACLHCVGSSFHDDSVIRRMVPSSLPMTVPAFMKLKEEEFVGSVSEDLVLCSQSLSVDCVTNPKECAYRHVEIFKLM